MISTDTEARAAKRAELVKPEPPKPLGLRDFAAERAAMIARHEAAKIERDAKVKNLRAELRKNEHAPATIRDARDALDKALARLPHGAPLVPATPAMAPALGFPLAGYEALRGADTGLLEDFAQAIERRLDRIRAEVNDAAAAAARAEATATAELEALAREEAEQTRLVRAALGQ